eukprot:scaffold4084_cov290-Prasinococcus_capsulatus_cf.AAC.5
MPPGGGRAQRCVGALPQQDEGGWGARARRAASSAARRDDHAADDYDDDEATRELQDYAQRRDRVASSEPIPVSSPVLPLPRFTANHGPCTS